MSQCRLCPSYAINAGHNGRDITTDIDLCDVCYWRTRAESEREFSEWLQKECDLAVGAVFSANEKKLRASQLIAELKKRLIKPDDFRLQLAWEQVRAAKIKLDSVWQDGQFPGDAEIVTGHLAAAEDVLRELRGKDQPR